MANHTSTIKAIRKTVKKQAINKSRTQRIRTFIKKVEIEVKNNNKEKEN